MRNFSGAIVKYQFINEKKERKKKRVLPSQQTLGKQNFSRLLLLSLLVNETTARISVVQMLPENYEPQLP